MPLNSISNLIQKGFVLLLSFVDDIAIFALGRLGLNWTWLHWVSTIALIATLIYWCIRLCRYYHSLKCTHQDQDTTLTMV